MNYRCLVLDYPGSRGVAELEHAFRSAGFDTQVLWLEDLLTDRLEQDQLFLRYKVLVLPNLLSDRSRWLSLKITHELRWNLKRYSERGAMVFAVGAATDALIHMGVFGEQMSVQRKRNPFAEESWIRVSPFGQRCEWLRGLGTMEFPIDSDSPELTASAAGQVEVLARLERLGMICLKSESGKTLGLCDVTGRILAMFPEPQFALQSSPNRLPVSLGAAKALFDNGQRMANQS